MTWRPAPTADVAISDGTATTNLAAFTAGTPEAFTYDDDGNLLMDGRWQYNWDAENRLISMESTFDNYFVPGLPRQRLTFAYDARSRRIEKRVFDYIAGSFQHTKTTKYLYDAGWNLLTEATQQGWRTYLWGSDLSGTLGDAGGIGGLLVENDPSQGPLVTAYDGNGNIKALLKASDGVIVAAYEYGPFGEPLRVSGPMAQRNPFRFSTHYTDAETGQVYAKRRSYLTTSGRWLSKDPIEERGGINLFEYAHNDGVNRVDPFGLMTEDEVNREIETLRAFIKIGGVPCCLNKEKMPNVTVSLSGVASFTTVTNTLTPKIENGAIILGYYWWDCNTAQGEAKDANGGGDLPIDWQKYGWRSGGPSTTATHDGASYGWFNRYDRTGSAHWNWTGIVVYAACSRGGHLTVKQQGSNQLEYDWRGYWGFRYWEVGGTRP